jgi:hypothetical protein
MLQALTAHQIAIGLIEAPAHRPDLKVESFAKDELALLLGRIVAGRRREQLKPRKSSHLSLEIKTSRLSTLPRHSERKLMCPTSFMAARLPTPIVHPTLEETSTKLWTFLWLQLRRW